MTLQSNITVHAVEATAHERPSEPPPNERRLLPSRVLLHLVLIFFGITIALPLLSMIFSSFKPLDEISIKPPNLLPMAPTAQNYQTAFGTGNFNNAFINSFYIAALVTIVSVLTCAMAAYAFARLRFPGNNLRSVYSWPR